MSLKECFEKGQLKRINPDLALAKKSFKRGIDILKEINALVDAEFIEAAEQRLYQAFFHMFKALLYKDGIKERSHYCTILYVQETYKNKLGKFISTVEILRDLRNQSQYGLESSLVNREEIDEWVKTGGELSKTLSEILSSS